MTKKLQHEKVTAWPIAMVFPDRPSHAITGFYLQGATYIYDGNAGARKLFDRIESSAQIIAKELTHEPRVIAYWLPTTKGSLDESNHISATSSAPLARNSTLVQSIYAAKRLREVSVDAWPLTITPNKGSPISVTVFHLAGHTYVYSSREGSRGISITPLQDPKQIAERWLRKTVQSAEWLPEEALASF